MIEGFKVELTSGELTDHLRQKSQQHATKSSEYQVQADGVSKLQPASGTSNDPVATLRTSSRQHDAKATYFDFLAKHVIANEVYRLSEIDLERLEFFSRY